ncbi:MAG: 2OG-Fe dioxygenase family protein [Pseudomonadota bacterium]
MTTSSFLPPCVPPSDLIQSLRRQGYALLNPQGVSVLCNVAPEQLNALVPSWNDLPPDQYLKDGGRYRRRRHASYQVHGDTVQAVPHRAHWQPLDYNALHGGMQRWFEPVSTDTAMRPAWNALLQALGTLASQLKGEQPWFVEAHQFRIDTTDGIGRPTPEGAHRDGVDLVAVFLVGRQGVKGGETRVFEAAGPNGQRFTLTEPWSLLLLDDARVIHESTPIQPLEAGGHRDTLVVTLRSGGFQDDRPPKISAESDKPV